MVLRPFIFQWQRTQMVVAGGFKRSVSKGGGGVVLGGGTRLSICVCECNEDRNAACDSFLMPN